MRERRKLGRLPLESDHEVETYLAKVRRWLAFVPTAERDLSLFGGKPFPVDVSISELGSLLALPERHATWRVVRKYFRTNGRYTRQALLSAVNGEDPSAVVYYFDHGFGNQWMLERRNLFDIARRDE